MPKSQEETLDDMHAEAALGAPLTPFHGESEASLSNARRTERIRERSEALAGVIRPEPVRRMTRKAGITSYATSAPNDEEVVITTLRKIADVVLFNLCFEVCRLCEHIRRKTVTEELLHEALRSFGLKHFGACDEIHQSCFTLKQHNRMTAAQHRGAGWEIHHELGHNDNCVYFAYAPFARLLRTYMQEQAQKPPKMTSGIISCMHFQLESLLIEVLEKARFLVRQTTKTKSNESSPDWKSVFSRDINTVLTVLAHRHPVFSGRMRPLYDDPTPAPSSGSPRGGARHGARANASPKAAAKGKAKAQPARAKAAARAKSGR